MVLFSCGGVNRLGKSGFQTGSEVCLSIGIRIFQTISLVCDGGQFYRSGRTAR